MNNNLIVLHTNSAELQAAVIELFTERLHYRIFDLDKPSDDVLKAINVYTPLYSSSVRPLSVKTPQMAERVVELFNSESAANTFGYPVGAFRAWALYYRLRLLVRLGRRLLVHNLRTEAELAYFSEHASCVKLWDTELREGEMVAESGLPDIHFHSVVTFSSKTIDYRRKLCDRLFDGFLTT